MAGDQRLRDNLQQITSGPEQPGSVPLDGQAEAVSAMKAQFAHTIDVFEPASADRANTNCFMYALGLSAGDVIEHCTEIIFPGSDFMTWLATNCLIELSAPSLEVAGDGDVVVYFNDAGRATHAGVLKGGLVISKWGALGTHIWRHALFEVPTSYGDVVRIYRAIKPDEAIRAFAAWAKLNG